MTFTAVVCSHANEPGLRSILGQLIYQTRPPDEIIACCSDTTDLMRLREDFPQVTFVEHRNFNDWGHTKRADGLGRASCDWVGFFNDDDTYSRDYLEKMLATAAAHDADAVWCSWNENPNGGFCKYQATAGNFIVRTRVGQRVGWNGRHYEADGDFIDAIVTSGARTVKLDEIVYWHNVQGIPS